MRSRNGGSSIPESRGVDLGGRWCSWRHLAGIFVHRCVDMGREWLRWRALKRCKVDGPASCGWARKSARWWRVEGGMTGDRDEHGLCFYRDVVSCALRLRAPAFRGFVTPSTVDGGHRAVIWDRFSGVQPYVMGEGTHFRIPMLQVRRGRWQRGSGRLSLPSPSFPRRNPSVILLLFHICCSIRLCLMCDCAPA